MNGLSRTNICRRGPAMRPGTALVEFAMCIPILAGIIAATFFFGWSMMNQQHVKQSDRYAAWHSVRGGGAVESADLNTSFFGDRAGDVEVAYGAGSTATITDFVSDSGSYNAAAQTYASDLVDNGFPTSTSAEVSAEFSSDIGLYKDLSGAIVHSHSREGMEWRRAQADYCEVLRDAYLLTLDGALTGMSGTASQLGTLLSKMYNTKW